jgi:uncharacterized phiE125 gp8 family phage protein
MADILDTTGALTDAQVVKQHLQIGHSESDVVLGIMVGAARDFVEGYCGLYLEEQEVVATVEGGGNSLWLPNGPVQSITEVLDTLHSLVIDATLYDHDGRVRVVRANQVRWDDGVDRYRVTYQGGYAAVADIPDGLRLAILDMCERAYRSPGGRKSEGSSSHRWEWQQLAGSDVLARLDTHRMHQGLG